ncbi:histidine phosphatase family protein [Bacillus sp. JJ722]|uniref:histidine phosphatase family protein n=1 Tax=Bacillus sp. JJ722 TaxID=3122973 RepID=UPI0030007374
MTTIGFIRHGITEWNNTGKFQGIADIPLNESGKKQATAIANRLYSEEQWDLIISSNLIRAKETAIIISRKLNIPSVIIDERIREINCGKLEGLTEEEIISKWGTNWRKLELGMESYENVQIRGRDFLEDTVIRYMNKRILVVSHGALIGLTLQTIMPSTFKKTNIDNTSLTILDYHNNKWACNLYNCTIHLDG